MDAPRTLRLDPANARVSFSVRWFGVLQVRGSFAQLSGQVGIPGANGHDASLAVQVEGSSVRTGIALRDRHLRGSRFLASSDHPVIRFTARDICLRNGAWAIQGTLSLRGRDRDVTVAVPDEPAGDGLRRLRAEFTVPRREHDIGTAHGIRALNPLLWAIADDVIIHVELRLPATLLQPTAAHAPSR